MIYKKVTRHINDILQLHVIQAEITIDMQSLSPYHHTSTPESFIKFDNILEAFRYVKVYM